MRSALYLALVFLCLAGVTPTPLRADDPSTLANLSLEELMEIEVTSASKLPGALSKAPTSMVVITRDDIKRFGYRTIAEALKNILGINVFTNQYSFAFFRGVAIGGDFNTRILLLVDGHKINDANYHQAFFGEEFPGDIENVERIEITKGPASSVWGTNAMLGLVNVVTRKGSQVGGTEVSGEYGSQERSKGFVAAGDRTEGGLEYNITASYLNGDGEDYLDLEGRDDLGRLVAKNADNQYAYRMSGRFDYEDLHLLTAAGTRWKQIPYGLFGAEFGDGGNTYEDGYAYLDLSYDKIMNTETNSRIFSRFFYDHNSFSGDFIYKDDEIGRYINHDSAIAKSYGFELRYSQDIMEDLSALAGIEVTDFYVLNVRNFNREPLSPDSIVADEPYTLTSFYAELHYQLLENLALIGGGRSDNYSSQDDAVTPRVSAVYEPFSGSTARLMYGEGFRASNNFERNYADGNFTISNRDLRPEEVRTIEAAWQQRVTDSVVADLSLYDIQFERLIAQTQLESGQFQYQNEEDDITSRGIELSMTARLKDGWSAYAGGTVFRAERDDRRLPASAEYLLNSGVSMPLYEEKLFLSPQVRYVSSLESGDIYTEIEGYWVADATLLATNLPGGWELSASIYNIFDESYSFPAGPVAAFTEFPEIGRNFMLRATWLFK